MFFYGHLWEFNSISCHYGKSAQWEFVCETSFMLHRRKWNQTGLERHEGEKNTFFISGWTIPVKVRTDVSLTWTLHYRSANTAVWLWKWTCACVNLNEWNSRRLFNIRLIKAKSSLNAACNWTFVTPVSSYKTMKSVCGSAQWLVSSKEVMLSCVTEAIRKPKESQWGRRFEEQHDDDREIKGWKLYDLKRKRFSLWILHNHTYEWKFTRGWNDTDMRKRVNESRTFKIIDGLLKLGDWPLRELGTGLGLQETKTLPWTKSHF